MAKDDYYTIVAKILVYLYKRLKKLDKTLPVDYIAPYTDDFPIDDDYMKYVISTMLDKGFISRVSIIKDMAGKPIMMDISDIQITPDGIDYLKDNNTIRKIAEVLKEAASIKSLFIPL